MALVFSLLQTIYRLRYMVSHRVATSTRQRKPSGSGWVRSWCQVTAALRRIDGGGGGKVRQLSLLYHLTL